MMWKWNGIEGLYEWALPLQGDRPFWPNAYVEWDDPSIMNALNKNCNERTQ